MSVESPAPLTPPGCDLTDYKFMPLEVGRLRRSKAWLLAKKNPALGFYMLNLWAAAWHEVPAGSLEDDDDVLADCAMCDSRKWLAVREQAMRGWTKCSDGRLYHPVVAEKVLDALDGKHTQRQRTANARAARLAARQGTSQGRAPPTTEVVTSSVTQPVTEVVTSSKGREGKGEGKEGKGESPLTPVNGHRQPDPMGTGMADLKMEDGRPTCGGFFVDSLFEACCTAAKINSVASVATWQPLIAWLTEGHTEWGILRVIRQIASRPNYKPPRTLDYFNRAVREEAKPGERPN